MLIEMIDYCRFMGGDSASYPQCSGQLGRGALILIVPHAWWCPLLSGVTDSGTLSEQVYIYIYRPCDT